MAVRNINNIRLWILRSLIFFALVGISGCGSNKTEDSTVTILYDDGQPVSLSIPRSYLRTSNQRKLEEKLKVRLAGSSEDIFGEYVVGESVRDTVQLNLQVSDVTT